MFGGVLPALLASGLGVLPGLMLNASDAPIWYRYDGVGGLSGVSAPKSLSNVATSKQKSASDHLSLP